MASAADRANRQGAGGLVGDRVAVGVESDEGFAHRQNRERTRAVQNRERTRGPKRVGSVGAGAHPGSGQQPEFLSVGHMRLQHEIVLGRQQAIQLGHLWAENAVERVASRRRLRASEPAG